MSRQPRRSGGNVRHLDQRGLKRLELWINEILDSEIPDPLGEFVQLFPDDTKPGPTADEKQKGFATIQKLPVAHHQAELSKLAKRLGEDETALRSEFEREQIIRASASRIREQRLTDAVAAAEHGDMRPARALVDAAVRYWLTRSPQSPHGGREIPSLSRFLQPLGRDFPGDRFLKDTTDKLRDIAWDKNLTSLDLAVKDAARIREIAKEHNLRRLTGDFSPTAIAARRWGVTDDQVLEWRKSKRRPRLPTK
jgi:hypothetical protein